MAVGAALTWDDVFATTRSSPVERTPTGWTGYGIFGGCVGRSGSVRRIGFDLGFGDAGPDSSPAPQWPPRSSSLTGHTGSPLCGGHSRRSARLA